MKQFLIIGTLNAVTYKDVFPYIKSNVVKYRPQCIHKFLNGAAAATWYTTLTVPELPFLELTKTYSTVDYPKYDNYNAIEVSKTKDIPMDYDGVMGVPLTFMDKYNPKQFKIIGVYNDFKEPDPINGIINGVPVLCYKNGTKPRLFRGPCINTKALYIRLLIKRK